jgi:hypothetical protein
MVTALSYSSLRNPDLPGFHDHKYAIQDTIITAFALFKLLTTSYFIQR